MEYLTWKIDGEFLTNLARDRLYKDRQPYSQVEKLLLDCLRNDDIAIEDTKYIIRQILSCKQKLVGINSFTLEEDDGSYLGGFDLDMDNLLSIIFMLKDEAIQLNMQNQRLERELAETKEILQEYIDDAEELNQFVEGLKSDLSPITKLRKYLATSSMVDIISWKNIFGDSVSDEIKEEFNDFCETYHMYPGRSVHGDWEWVSFYDKETNEILAVDDFNQRGASIQCTEERSFTKQNNQDESPEDILEYGFLTPKGEFLVGPWGSHTELAYQIIDNNDWYEEFRNWDKSHDRTSSDFLVYVKHYVLLHNPSAIGRVQVTRNTEYRLTKAQKEFLYDYLMKDGQDIFANHIMMEE